MSPFATLLTALLLFLTTSIAAPFGPANANLAATFGTPLDPPKANEYKSGDCSGDINYGHHSVLLDHVTMADNTHSVYLASPNGMWYAYEKKENGRCAGRKYGALVDKCVNIDTHFEWLGRIKCVSWE